MNPFEGMTGLVKNPLGILAIFLGVIYGIAALLLGAGATALESQDRHILTWLIAIFPFVTLGLFGWLVSCHHTKLYGPRDYRSDRSFLDSVSTPTPEERDAKIEKEAEAIQIESSTAEVTALDPKLLSKRKPAAAETLADRTRLIRAREEAILDGLESEFSAFRRGAKLASRSGRDVLIDAMGLSGSEVTLIEIIAAKYEHTVSMRARDVALQFASIAPTFPSDVQVNFMLCVTWLEDRPSNADRALRNASRIFEDIGLRNVIVREFPEHQ